MNRHYRKIIFRKEMILLFISLGFLGGGAASVFFSNKNPEFCSLLLAIGLFLSWVTFQIWMNDYCLIHPYFERQLPEESPRTAFQGEHLAKNLDELDDFLVEHQYSAISKFGFKDHYQNSKLDWYDPAELIRSLEFLLNQKKIWIRH